MPPSIIFSPYKNELDMKDKDSAKLFEKGSNKLPTKFSSIMLTHEYIQLLKNRHKIYNMISSSTSTQYWIPYKLYFT
jgi:hypothetical protein